MQEPSSLIPFVQASAALLGIPMDAERARRVAAHLSRSAAMAASLEAAGLEPHDEPAELYRPAPFPTDAEAA